MQPSSLIFLVIIAIWAAYLLQHWVRRREHLATARSVDRFSEAMHVLERRSPLPESDLSAPQPRSYAVSPARSARSQRVVKRAQSPAPVPAGPVAAVRPTRAFHALASISARRLRGLSLLASLSLAAVVPVLAAFSVLPWWSAPVALVVLVADLAWLRHAAVAERSSRRAGVLGRGSVAAQAGSTARAANQYSDQSAPVVANPALVAESEAGAGATEAADAPAECDPSSWAPVPVPPPTYTLKAKAEPPVRFAAPVAEPETALTSSFDGLVDEGELDELLDRRQA